MSGSVMGGAAPVTAGGRAGSRPRWRRAGSPLAPVLALLVGLLVACGGPTPAPTPTPASPPVVAAGTPAPVVSPGPPSPAGPTSTAMPRLAPERVFEEPVGPITVAVGEVFALELRELVSAGYRFSYVRRPDPAILTELDTTSRQVAPGLVGSPDWRRWLFRAVGEGTTTIVLQSVRPGVTVPATPSGYAREPVVVTVNVVRPGAAPSPSPAR